VPLFCSSRISTSSVVYYWTDTWQPEIYFLTRQYIFSVLQYETLCTCIFLGTKERNLWVTVSGSIWILTFRAIIVFWVTCSLILHACSKLVMLWVNSFNFKRKSSILSRNRCYGLGLLMTVLLLNKLVTCNKCYSQHNKLRPFWSPWQLRKNKLVTKFSKQVTNLSTRAVQIGCAHQQGYL